MCGRYAATLPPEMMVELFNLLNQIDFPPRYNITPTQPIAVVWEQSGRRTIQLVRWGFVPGWVKDPREFSLLINARAETMAEKPSFRDAVRNSRCIVPASGYYEWMKGKDGVRRPYYITMADGSPMVFAGLYSTWSGPDGEEVDTACIVTVEPNLEISSIYDRMPAMLTGENVDLWLNTRDIDTRAATQLALPLPAGSLKYHPVGKAVGRTDVDEPALIREMSAEELAAEDETRARKPKKAAAGGGQLDLF
ncbi:SOS response-associated peptidase [Devosia sp. ZB163]|uniref:SOS response-associated peptidase n=1 Tax=Devosia sp. ZB163 TaxID=3025938 RepID=UPI0023607582|nr:SOS response-associated peptidase [Devosia sp. ZB163]MDC9822637.1 SOS response-associated peptidase [Devosia sp. ZB163]